MKKIALAVAAVAAILTTAPVLIDVAPVMAQTVKMAQGLDIQVGRDRDDRDHRRRHDSDVTVGAGPGGLTVGPRHRESCRTVTTTVQRDDGRMITRKERRCD